MPQNGGPVPGTRHLRTAMSLAAPLTAADLWADVLAVRAQSPLVHSITNFVVMNFNANVLLALGAAPVMAHAHDEVADMAGIAQALVLNIGTLEPAWVESMHKARRASRSCSTRSAPAPPPIATAPCRACSRPARPP